jgi:hypothetical protein
MHSWRIFSRYRQDKSHQLIKIKYSRNKKKLVLLTYLIFIHKFSKKGKYSIYQRNNT